MADKLLAEFPETTFEQWREQVEKDLKGADFQKRLVTRTLDGLEVQPLYTARDLPSADVGFAGLTPYRRGSSPVGRYGARWDLRSEHSVWDIGRAKGEIAAELARGATSLWLRFDAAVRSGATNGSPDGLPCASAQDLEELLAGVDLARTPVALDAGSNAAAVAACYWSVAAKRGIEQTRLQGSLGLDPLGALAQDGRAPHSLAAARELLVEVAQRAAKRSPQLRSVVVSTTPYHDAGAAGATEVAIALGTALTYLRWLLEAGMSVGEASAQLEFRVGVAGDLFAELAKLRALRIGYAKLVAALGGDEPSQSLRLHAVTARRTKTLRDPWVNMLRTTTEAFSAMAGGADSLTTRGFDELLGPSDAFARRIARNVQVILNEEAHVTHVADPAGGSYYVESLTETIARDAWKRFQQLEAGGGLSAALESGKLQAEIAEIADKRDKAISKRSIAITGVNEFANLSEEPLVREHPTAAKVASVATAGSGAGVSAIASAKAGARLEAAIQAFDKGASLRDVSAALGQNGAPVEIERLPLRRHAERFEGLRARSEAHAKKSGKPPSAFLANLGSIPQHKARAGFTTGFLNAGGITAVENDGFADPAPLVEAFRNSGTKLAVICGTDEQYVEWVPKLAPLLAKAGAVEVLVAGRPGEQEATYKAAGVTGFIFVGSDVAATLSSLLDRSGVAS